MKVYIAVFIAGIITGIGIEMRMNRRYIDYLRECFFDLNKKGKELPNNDELKRMWEYHQKKRSK